MDEMEELKQEFLSEANDLLVLMEEEVLKLEGDPNNRESVNSIFRVAHTLKGGASALELERITVFTHNLENLFDLVRDDKMGVDEDLIDIVLASLDILKELVKAATMNTEAQGGIEKETLERIIAKAAQGTGAKAPVQPVTAQQTVASVPVVEEKQKGAVNLADLLVNNIGNDVDIKDVVLKEFNVNPEVSEKIKKEVVAGKNIYIVHVHLDPEYEMRSVSGIQTITGIRSLGELITGNPPVAQVMEEEFIEDLRFLLLSKEKGDKIYSKLYISDVTIDVEVENISELFGQAQEQQKADKKTKEIRSESLLDKVPEQEITPEISAEIENSLEEGFFVYSIRILINENVPMRDVDSLLVLTTLEEVGDIISAIPSKRDLQNDIYYPVLDIIVYTKETKEKIKERCYIEDTILEMRVSEFRLKSAPAPVRPEEKTDTIDFNDMPSPTPTPSLNIMPVNESIGSLLGAATEPIKTPQAPVEAPIIAPQTSMSRLTSKEEARVVGKGVGAGNTGNALKNFLKVDSTRVDSLLNMVSELVISKAALLEMTMQTVNKIGEFKISLPDIQGILENNISDATRSSSANLTKVDHFITEVQKTWYIMDYFENTVNSVSRSINELQEGIMKIRMVPMSNVFNRFPRLVRDVSKQLNKKIKLELIGEETELDKSIIEELADPLMHMIRNSLDHGIEMPDVRLRNGKPEEGTVTLKAVHEGSVIRIEIEDDGGGLDAERIKAKAIQKGIISASQSLSKDEVYQLIMQPGFSTAEVITDLSGRGVGMDVVRRNIEDLAGKLTIESEKGKGTKFIIKIPLTLSIIQALIVKVQGYYYSVPLNVISETIPLNKKDLQQFERSEVIHLAGEIITVIDIRTIFNIKESRSERMKRIEREMFVAELNNENEDNQLLETYDDIKEEQEQEGIVEEGGLDAIDSNDDNYLIIVSSGNKRVGLLVDNVISEQDIVIKPLHKDYALTKGVNGATILGDGSISLILDVFQVIDLYLKKDELVSIN